MTIRNRLLLSFGIVAAIFFANGIFVVQRTAVIADGAMRFVTEVSTTADAMTRARLELHDVYRDVVEPTDKPVADRLAEAKKQVEVARQYLTAMRVDERERSPLLAKLAEFEKAMVLPVEHQATPGQKMEIADSLAEQVMSKLREVGELKLVDHFNAAVMAFNDYLITHDEVEHQSFATQCTAIRESPQLAKFAEEFGRFETAGREVFVAAKVYTDELHRFRAVADAFDEQLAQADERYDSGVARPLGDTLASLAGKVVVSTKVAGFITLLVTGGVSWLMVHQLISPLRRTTRALQEIAEGDGDLSRELPENGRDEIAELGRAFNHFVQRIRGTVVRIRDISHSLSAASDGLSGNATELAVGVQQTTAQSTTIGAAAEEMSANMASMANYSHEIFANVQGVSTAIGQVTATINDIARNSDHAAHVAGDAAELAAAGNECIGNLGEAAQEIGRVIEVIQDIAEQTNLLALNATIEAARAGEAGKGFAVVATEVKELARQTASATDDIRSRIEAIQSTACRAVQSIEGITNVIRQVKDVSCAIAAAVEEQSHMVQQISEKITSTSTAVGTVAQGVSESASATREITQNLSGMDQVISQSSTTASATRTSSTELADMAAQLQSLVSQFRVRQESLEQSISA